MLHCWQSLSPPEISIFLNGVKIEWPKAIIFDSCFVVRLNTIIRVGSGFCKNLRLI